jgi:hypothetical protein
MIAHPEDEEDMAALFILIIVLAVLVGSVLVGVDSRHTDVNGHYRPNL